MGRRDIDSMKKAPAGRAEQVRRMEGIWIGTELALLALFLFLCAVWKGSPVIPGLLYGAAALGITAWIHSRITKLTDEVLQRIDDTILDLINGQPGTRFDFTEDDLLGKFQNQIEKLYEILNSHKEQEKKLRESLSGLVADLVHQINTPLTNIAMYTTFLNDEEMDRETRNLFLQRIQGQVEKLKWFGEGFDKVARLETDIIHLSPVEQELFPILLGAIDQAAPRAREQGMEISLEGDAKLRAWCDRKWTEEAVFNLLDNAVKYAARPGTIKVRAAAFDLYLKIEVEDISAPIEPGEYNRIFQRFYRGKTAAMVQEGVGLGLFLTRQIITGQKGYMEVSRGKQGGNVFSVFLLKGKETAKCSP